jgi:hypothetical protein
MPLLEQAGGKKELEIYSSFAQMLSFKKGKSFSVLFENIHTKPVFEKQLLQFFEMINSLDYEEKPNYKKLIDALMSCQ